MATKNVDITLKNLINKSATNLRLFRAFYKIYNQIQQIVSVKLDIPKLEIQQTVSVKSIDVPVDKLLNTFTFSHFIELLRIDDDLQRVFYEVEAIKGNWSVRELKRQINSQVYERVGLSFNKKELIDSLNLTEELESLEGKVNE